MNNKKVVSAVIASISDDIPELKVIQMPFLYSDAQDIVGCVKW